MFCETPFVDHGCKAGEMCVLLTLICFIVICLFYCSIWTSSHQDISGGLAVIFTLSCIAEIFGCILFKYSKNSIKYFSSIKTKFIVIEIMHGKLGDIAMNLFFDYTREDVFYCAFKLAYPSQRHHFFV